MFFSTADLSCKTLVSLMCRSCGSCWAPELVPASAAAADDDVVVVVVVVLVVVVVVVWLDSVVTLTSTSIDVSTSNAAAASIVCHTQMNQVNVHVNLKQIR